MVIVMNTASGTREPEMNTQSYADEVLLAGWADVPHLPADAGAQVAPRLAEVASEPPRPSPFADPDFIARIYRAQR